MTRTRFECTPPSRAGNVPLPQPIGGPLVLSKHRSIWCVFRCLVLAAAVFLLVTGAPSTNAQGNPSIDQSRLYPRTIPPTAGDTSAGTLSGPQVEVISSDDESFGAQQILKEEGNAPQIFINATSSIYYTSNVALTRSDPKPEAFSVSDVGVSWIRRVNPQLQFQLGGALGLFRYETSALDFESVGAGTGFIWTPPHVWDLSFTTRYDFVELLDHHTHRILLDHQFSLAVQKFLALGRSHALTFGAIGSLGISDPITEQRDQAGFAIAYHLQIARNFGADAGYRHSWYFYNRDGRVDLNQVLSLGLHYNVTPWFSVNGYLSGALNDSNRDIFEYDVFSGGGGLAATFRF